MSEMSKIGVIGKQEKISAFASVGFDIRHAENAEMAGQLLNQMASEGYGVIFLAEDYMEQLSEECGKYTELPTPAIIPIPTGQGDSFGMAQLTRYIERAVGSDIEFGE